MQTLSTIILKTCSKKDVNNEYIHGEWLNAEYALSQASDSNQKKMLKCLAVINIVNKPDELPADEQDLYMAAEYLIQRRHWQAYVRKD